MGIRFDPATNTWTASYSRRPGPGVAPISKTVKKIGSEKAAQKVLEQIMSDVMDKSKFKLAPRWSFVVEKYFDQTAATGISGKTLENYRYNIIAHTFPKWEKLSVQDITAKQILEVINVDLKDKASSHRKYVLKILRNIFTFAVNEDFVSRNPTPSIHFKKQEKLKGVLTKDQVMLFLTTAKELNHEWYPHWFMALYTGMRNGELYALKWDRINLENNFIVIDSAWNNVDGIKSTKSGDDRILEIAPDLRYLLAELKVRNGDGEFVLPRISSWNKGEQARELRKFLIGLNLPQIRFHDLRATWATLLLSSGLEPIKVMKMGGWKDLKTLQIYIRKSGIDIKGCMEGFSLHNPSAKSAKVFHLSAR